MDVAVSYGGKTPPGFERVARSVTGAFDGSVSRQSGSVYETHLCVRLAEALDGDASGGAERAPCVGGGGGG